MPPDRKNKYCKECWREISKQSRLKNPEAAKAATRRWVEANRERVREYARERLQRPGVAEKRREENARWRESSAGKEWTKQYREKRRDIDRALLAEWRKANPERLKALKKASYERIGRETAKKWREQNAEKLRLRSAERWAREKSVILARLRRWRKTRAGVAFVEKHRNAANVKFAARYRSDPEFRTAVLVREAKRRAKYPERFKEYWRRADEKRGKPPVPPGVKRECVPTPGGHTVEEWMDLYIKSDGKCRYCECALTLATASPDHAIPVSRGGSDNIDNLRVSCWPCNRLKKARTEEEFVQFLLKSR